MITQKPAEKTLAFLLLGAAVLIGIIHVFYPVTLSSPNLSERTGVPVMIAIFAALTAYGYRWARIGIGFSFVLFAAINLLLVLAYFPGLSLNQLTQFIISTLILGSTGLLFLKWKGIRVFEEERGGQKLANF